MEDGIPLRGFFNNDSAKMAAAGPDAAVHRIFNATEPETPIAGLFHDTEVSRKNIGVNGYFSFNPNSDISINVSGGYGISRAISTSVRDAIVSFNEREAKTAYANLHAQLFGLQINYGFESGPQDYAYGVPGYKIQHNMMNGGVEYTLKLGDLSVKPAFDFQWAKYTDYLRFSTILLTQHRKTTRGITRMRPAPMFRPTATRVFTDSSMARQRSTPLPRVSVSITSLVACA